MDLEEGELFSMILFTALAIKVLLVLVVMYFGWRFFYQKLSINKMLFLCGVVIAFALIANMISGFLPPLTDQVVLTALGSKNDNAQHSEVYLSGYTIDGKEFMSGKSLDIEEGHWFWSGETYAWRPETDSRQPDGMTRTVVLKIPVGWNRTLDFAGNIFRGEVEISTKDGKRTVDTYAENNTTIFAEIGRSETSALILNQIRYLAVYAGLLFACSLGLAFAVRTMLRSPGNASEWMKHNAGKLTYLGISVTTFLLMLHYADRGCFWFDELCQISFVKDSLSKALECCLKLMECSPPLALICSAIWYRIAPYGEQWLLLICILLTAVSIYIMGLIGERLQGRYCGTLAAIMTAFSTTVWSSVAYEYRAYPYLVAFSVLTLYLYIRKNENGNTPGWKVAFSISMAALAMSHYFGMLACAVYFFGDLFLWRKNQVKWKEGFLYLFPGMCSIIWLGAVAVYQGRSFVSDLQWYGVPSASAVRSLLRFLTGQTDLSYWILLLGVACAVARCMDSHKQGNHQFDWSTFYKGFFVAAIVSVITILFLYGVYINPQSTLWSARYFLFLIPKTILLSSLGLCDLSACLGEKSGKLVAQKIAALFMGIFLLLDCLVVMSTSKSTEVHRETADWLYQQSNYIFNDSTIIITTNPETVRSGWDEYYITRQGRRDFLNTASQEELSREEVLQYDRIYVSYLHRGISPWLQTLLNENYTVAEDRSDLQMRTYVRK